MLFNDRNVMLPLLLLLGGATGATRRTHGSRRNHSDDGVTVVSVVTFDGVVAIGIGAIVVADP